MRLPERESVTVCDCCSTMFYINSHYLGTGWDTDGGCHVCPRCVDARNAMEAADESNQEVPDAG